MCSRSSGILSSEAPSWESILVSLVLAPSDCAKADVPVGFSMLIASKQAIEMVVFLIGYIITPLT